jgi:ATP-dependent RNA helicase DDX10/DBP4
MEQTYGFECGNLQILILDEADRLLDMGFSESLNHIVRNLPEGRQTLLFSATQTKSVRDLARLSLNDPQYIAVHDSDDAITSSRLSQHFMVISSPCVRSFECVISY